MFNNIYSTRHCYVIEMNQVKWLYFGIGAQSNSHLTSWLTSCEWLSLTKYNLLRISYILTRIYPKHLSILFPLLMIIQGKNFTFHGLFLFIVLWAIRRGEAKIWCQQEKNYVCKRFFVISERLSCYKLLLGRINNTKGGAFFPAHSKIFIQNEWKLVIFKNEWRLIGCRSKLQNGKNEPTGRKISEVGGQNEDIIIQIHDRMQVKIWRNGKN